MWAVSTFLAILLLSSTTVFGQIDTVIVPPTVRLPNDTVLRVQLLKDLNGFLSQKEKPNRENTYILKENLPETSLLLDDMKGMEINKKVKDSHFYKPYLTNILRLSDTTFTVQFSYMGVTDNTPVLRASYRIAAQKKNGQFYFLSPLKQNTALWKTKQIGDYTFYYKNTLNSTKATEFQNTITSFDRKLKAVLLPTDFYCCDSYEEVLQISGIDYIADYNGYNRNSTFSNENNRILMLDGVLTYDFTRFDPHDLFHSRLRKVISPDIINRPVDEGCAYVYGGSWGISWDEIKEKFKEFVAKNPKADWISEYGENKNFVEGDKPLAVAFMINALLVQKIEKEKGFNAVLELVSCGKKEKGDENYFKALEKITGISKANYSAEVWKLIKE